MEKTAAPAGIWFRILTTSFRSRRDFDTSTIFIEQEESCLGAVWGMVLRVRKRGLIWGWDAGFGGWRGNGSVLAVFLGSEPKNYSL